MSRVSCIEHPARDPFVLLRSDYMELVDGDAAAAMLLAAFEQWTNSRLNNAEERGGDLWIFRSIEELVADDLVRAFGRDRVSKALNKLLRAEYLERRNNPDRRWDRTLQYRLNLTTVQEAIDTLENGLNMHSRISADASSEIAVSVGEPEPAEVTESPAPAQDRISDNGSGPHSRKSDDALSDSRPSIVGNPTMNSDSDSEQTPTTTPPSPQRGNHRLPTPPSGNRKREREAYNAELTGVIAAIFGEAKGRQFLQARHAVVSAAAGGCDTVAEAKAWIQDPANGFALTCEQLEIAA